MKFKTPFNKTVFLLMAALLPLLSFGKGKETPDTISARRAFADLTDSSLDLLPKNTRLDMLDYLDVDSIYTATNSLGGQSRLLKVAPGYLSVRITNVSTMEFKILKMKDGREIVMTVYTAGEPGGVEESEINFYDAALRQLPLNKYFPDARLSWFFDIPKGYSTSMKEIEELLPFYTIVYETNPDNDTVKARLALGDILTIEDMKLVEMFVKPEVFFNWDGKKYTMQKQ